MCYQPTYRDYEYLRPDMVIVYGGYNDVRGPSRRTKYDCYRQSSAIFRWTGIFPTAPIFFKERWYKFRYDSITQGYEIARARVLAKRGATPPTADPELDSYQNYEQNVLEFVTLLLDEGKGVVFASQPYLGDSEHLAQQDRIRVALKPHMSNPRFQYRDFRYLFEGKWAARYFNVPEKMWLNAAGNRILAETFVKPVTELIEHW